jgi:hypothetical protein
MTAKRQSVPNAPTNYGSSGACRAIVPYGTIKALVRPLGAARQFRSISPSFAAAVERLSSRARPSSLPPTVTRLDPNHRTRPQPAAKRRLPPSAQRLIGFAYVPGIASKKELTMIKKSPRSGRFIRTRRAKAQDREIEWQKGNEYPPA